MNPKDIEAKFQGDVNNSSGHERNTKSCMQTSSTDEDQKNQSSSGMKNDYGGLDMSSSTRDEGRVEYSDEPDKQVASQPRNENIADSTKCSEKPLIVRDDSYTSLKPPPPLPKDEKYIDSTLSPIAQKGALKGLEGLNSTTDDKSNVSAKLDVPVEIHKHVYNRSNSNLEIQNIMEQFNDGKGGMEGEEAINRREALTSPVLPPPRTSSLEVRGKKILSPTFSPTNEKFYPASPTSPKSPQSQSRNRSSVTHNVSNVSRPAMLAHNPLPKPEPEPELPFDFHRFLEQLRHRTADPVAKFLRSFLNEFGKKQWMVHEQVKIISDFLEFISRKMAQCEVWRNVSEVEFDNAREGMEKLVMNRLYSHTFSPVIPSLESFGSTTQPKGSQLGAKLDRRGQHQEDVERDDVLAQKMRIYAWVTESHLDIKPLGDKGRKFLALAQQELLKINSYRAPRDKIICILNCCKVIFGSLRASQSDQSADSFIPLLIYTVLHAKPEHLVSNVQYILRFRNQDKLSGEAGYYISSLTAAIQFIETIDRTSLTISDEDFEKHVENAVSAIAERHNAEEPQPQNQPPLLEKRPSNFNRLTSPHRVIMTEKSSISRPEVTPRNSFDAERIPTRLQLAPARGGSVSDVAGSSNVSGEGAAVAGLLRSIQRPLSSIGRMFSDDPSSSARRQQEQPRQQRREQNLQSPPRRSSADPPTARMMPRSGDGSRLSPEGQSHRRSSEDAGRRFPRRSQGHERVGREQMTAEDAAASHASAETAEAERIQRAEHRVVVDTLAGMFPDLDREVVDDVVRMKEGRVGLAVDACLALSN